MTTKDVRRAALIRLLEEDTGATHGKKARLAQRIGKKPAQISQWLSGFRTIEEESAREIERNAGKPPRWMDHDDTSGQLVTAPLRNGLPNLSQAMQVVADALAHVSETRRAELVKVFELLAAYPDEPDYLARMDKLLTVAGPIAVPGKRRSNGE